jgi:hypothetical protein
MLKQVAGVALPVVLVLTGAGNGLTLRATGPIPGDDTGFWDDGPWDDGPGRTYDDTATHNL